MAIKVMADNNETINVAQDAALYNVFAANSDFVIKDIGNELSVNHNSASFNVTINSGECVICGRHVTITGSETLTLTANTVGYILLRYDKSQRAENICKLVGTTSLNYYSENLNNTGTIHDLVLGQFTTNDTGVVSFTDKRSIIESVIPEISENAVSASKLETARVIALTGAVTGSTSFDGSANVSIATSIGSIPTIYNGTTEPDSSVGKNGDIYILYTA